jgi:hypothetical protein
MKSVKGVCAGLIVSLMVFSATLWANEECPKKNEQVKPAHAARTKVLKDAAIALQQIQPEIAKGLNEYVAEEERIAQEWKAKRESDTKLLKDAAAALQASHPDLAKGLQVKAEGKPKKKDDAQRQEWKKAKQEARVKLLKDAAAALQTSNPDLSKQLRELCLPNKKKTF